VVVQAAHVYLGRRAGREGRAGISNDDTLPRLYQQQQAARKAKEDAEKAEAANKAAQDFRRLRATVLLRAAPDGLGALPVRVSWM
jgi:hypothetical protein